MKNLCLFTMLLLCDSWFLCAQRHFVGIATQYTSYNTENAMPVKDSILFDQQNASIESAVWYRYMHRDKRDLQISLAFTERNMLKIDGHAMKPATVFQQQQYGTVSILTHQYYHFMDKKCRLGMGGGLSWSLLLSEMNSAATAFDRGRHPIRAVGDIHRVSLLLDIPFIMRVHAKHQIDLMIGQQVGFDLYSNTRNNRYRFFSTYIGFQKGF